MYEDISGPEVWMFSLPISHQLICLNIAISSRTIDGSTIVEHIEDVASSILSSKLIYNRARFHPVGEKGVEEGRGGGGTFSPGHPASLPNEP